MTVGIGDGEASGPVNGTRRGGGKLVEVDGGVGRDCRAWIIERSFGGVGSVNSCNSRDMIHLKVTSRHEFNVHDFPDTSGIGIPSNMTGCALIEDVTGTRLGWVGVGTNESSASNEGTEKELAEHISSKLIRDGY